jgi:hypothetical protein
MVPGTRVNISWPPYAPRNDRQGTIADPNLKTDPVPGSCVLVQFPDGETLSINKAYVRPKRRAS